MTACVNSLRSALLVNGRKESQNVVSKSVSTASSLGSSGPQSGGGAPAFQLDAAKLNRANELELQQLEREENAAKDKDSIKRALSGEILGFQELVQRYERRVYSVAFAVLGNSEDAKDVTQETFIRVYQRLDSFRGESGFYTWLYRVAFNLAVDLSRKRYRTRELGFSDGEGSDTGGSGVRLDGVSESSFSGSIESPDKTYERGEVRRQLNKAMLSLSEEHRAVIAMRELDGLSYTEIAEAVGISKGTVMSRLHHARRKLQQYLQKTV